MTVRLSLGMSTPRIRGIRLHLHEANRRSRHAAARPEAAAHPSSSALSLLVAGVVADHVHLAPAADDLAMLANPLDARSDLHRAECSLPGRFATGPPHDQATPPSGP